METTHEARVAAVAAQLRDRPARARVTIRKATPSHSIRDTGYQAGSMPWRPVGYLSKLIWRTPAGAR